ncbi:MAG TPA: hypothetical protein PLK08_07315, partial [Phycisphaerae bacterium]|nr:hypothetical protein [Phycisphaerae bacterium]
MDAATLKTKMDAAGYAKLQSLNCPKLIEFISTSAELCKPEKIVLCNGTKEEYQSLMNEMIKEGLAKK